MSSAAPPSGRWRATSRGELLWDARARELHALHDGQEWTAAVSVEDVDRLLAAVRRAGASGREECVHYHLPQRAVSQEHEHPHRHADARSGVRRPRVWMCLTIRTTPAVPRADVGHQAGGRGEVRRWRVRGTVQRVEEVVHQGDDQVCSAARMARLVHVARLLGPAEGEGDVLDVIGSVGAAALGAAGVIFCFREPKRSVMRTISTSYFGDRARAEVAEVPDDFPLPMIATARTGQAHFFPDRASAVAAFPGGADLYERSATFASAVVPLAARGETFGSLAVAFAEDHAWPPAERDLLEAFAALTAQALDRLRAREAERTAAAAAQRVVETLRRTLVPDLPSWTGLRVAVRYQPVSGEVQLGGDWYDAFPTGDGDLVLVIGDVVGHDGVAAVGMAQMRDLLRGVAQSVDARPGQVLTTLDGALTALDVDVLATVLLCRLHRLDESTWQLQWSNAGHPPPVLLHPCGTAQLLERDSDVLLGLGIVTDRHDHQVQLTAGTTLVLYTDGLVERRQDSLREGTSHLLRVVRDAQAGVDDPDSLCERLVSALGTDGEDDVTVVVIEVG